MIHKTFHSQEPSDATKGTFSLWRHSEVDGDLRNVFFSLQNYIVLVSAYALVLPFVLTFLSG